MPILPPSSTYSGGAQNDNLYLRAGQPVTLPSGSTLTSAVNLKASDASTTGQLYVKNNADGAYKGGINLVPGANASAGNNQAAGITVRTIAGAAPGSAATSVDIGSNTQGPNHLYIAGLNEAGEVYDTVYNQVIKGTALVDVKTTLNSSSPATATRQFQFTAPASGAYMLQIDFNYYNVDTTPTIVQPVVDGATIVGGFIQPAGAVEWTVTTLPPLAAGEIQFMSSTILATDLIKQSQLDAVSEPMDFTTSNMGFLQKDGQYNINLYAIKPNPVGSVTAGDWNLSDIRVRLIQMC